MKSYWLDNIKVYSMDSQEETISLDMFNLDHHIPTLTLVGDTRYTEDEMNEYQPFFKDLASALTNPRFPVVVVDGATDFGVMKLFGTACGEIERRPAALIGVTLRTAIEDEKMVPEPHHTHLLLTSGGKGEWEKEVPIMQRVRAIVADKKPSALLAVGGGLVTLRHMSEHAKRGIPLFVLLGTGSLPQGFIEAGKEVPDYTYHFPIHEHKNLLRQVTILNISDPQQAINTLIETLHKVVRSVHITATIQDSTGKR